MMGKSARKLEYLLNIAVIHQQMLFNTALGLVHLLLYRHGPQEQG
jgi:hypothetical protein